MAFYGERLNYGYDPVRDDIYPLFSQYFENPRMVKIKDIDNYSMYMIKIHALLIIEFRYLIVFVKKNNEPVGDAKFLSQLEWESLQTRTLTDEHDIPFHVYNPRRFSLLDKQISLRPNNKKKYVYDVENLPIEITLLPKTNVELEYHNSGNVINALESYQTLINFK